LGFHENKKNAVHPRFKILIMKLLKAVAIFGLLAFCTIVQATVPAVLDHWFDTTWKTTGASFCEIAANFQATHAMPRPGFARIAYTFTYGSNDRLGDTKCVLPRNSDVDEINEFNVAGYRASHIAGVYKFYLYEYGQQATGWTYADNHVVFTPVPVFGCPPNSGNLNRGVCTCDKGFVENSGGSCVVPPRARRRR
jgi:hypothetical protein